MAVKHDKLFNLSARRAHLLWMGLGQVKERERERKKKIQPPKEIKVKRTRTSSEAADLRAGRGEDLLLFGLCALAARAFTLLEFVLDK